MKNQSIPSILPACISWDTPKADSGILKTNRETVRAQTRSVRKQLHYYRDWHQKKLTCRLINAYVPGLEVYCMATISMEEADRLTYAGTPPSLRVEPTATQKSSSYCTVHNCDMVLHVLVVAANQTRNVLYRKLKLWLLKYWSHSLTLSLKKHLSYSHKYS